MAADAVHTDELGDGHLLAEHRLFVVDRVRVGSPLDRFVGHPERMEDVVVEPVLAEQQFMHALEERSRFRALDDPVVVRAGDRDHLAHAERAEVATVGALELGRVVDAADADDHTLAWHQSRYRLDRADRARVGERHVGALEVLDGELVVLDLADDLLVGGEEAGEVERVGVADHGHDERAAAVGLRHIHGEAHVDVVVHDEARLAVGTFEERVLHPRHLVGDGADDGVADEVGEADLGQPGALPEPVDHLAVDLEQLGGDVAEAGGGGNVQAALHVGGDGRARAPDRLAGFGCRGWRSVRHGSRSGRRRRRGQRFGDRGRCQWSRAVVGGDLADAG